MQALINLPINFSSINSPTSKYNEFSINKYCIYKKSKFSQPINCYTHSTIKIEFFHKDKDKFKTGALKDVFQFSGISKGKDGILRNRGRMEVVVKSNKGLNEFGGGGGGGVSSETSKVLGNLALAILLTYLTLTGQLGWLFDAIVSLWLIAVLVPIVGIGAFLWWAGRDIVQGSCPNCGNEFQIFKSTMNDEIQLCPFCTQPFSVVGDEFVSDPVTFSNQSTRFDQAFSDFSPQAKKKGKGSSSVAVVDIEAEIRDVE